MSECDVVNMRLRGAFDESLLVILVLLSFSGYACQVGSHHVSGDAGEFWRGVALILSDLWRLKCWSLHLIPSSE